VHFAARRKSPFDASIQIETTVGGEGASGCCSPEQLQSFARELQRLPAQPETAPTTAAFFDSPANDDDAGFCAEPTQESFFSGVKTLLTRRPGVLRDLFAEPGDGSSARAVLNGEIDGKACRLIHVALRETPANRILLVELSVGDRTVRAFSNPQAIGAFLAELRESSLLGP
jgi:hypothetical protein